jgi:hypothetical protein
MQNLEQFIFSINRDADLLDNVVEKSSYNKMVFSYSEELKYEIAQTIKKYSKILEKAEAHKSRSKVIAECWLERQADSFKENLQQEG